MIDLKLYKESIQIKIFNQNIILFIKFLFKLILFYILNIIKLIFVFHQI